jgi:hypothetical protein
MSETIDRTPRAATTRQKSERPTTWRPPSLLDAPPPPDGFVHRWRKLWQTSTEPLDFDLLLK